MDGGGGGGGTEGGDEASKDDDDDDSSGTVVAVVVVLLLLVSCGVLAAFLYVKKRDDDAVPHATLSSFTNPSFNNPSYVGDDGKPLGVVSGGTIVRHNRTSVRIKDQSNNETLYDIPMDMSATASASTHTYGGDNYAAAPTTGTQGAYGGDNYSANETQGSRTARGHNHGYLTVGDNAPPDAGAAHGAGNESYEVMGQGGGSGGGEEAYEVMDQGAAAGTYNSVSTSYAGYIAPQNGSRPRVPTLDLGGTRGRADSTA